MKTEAEQAMQLNTAAVWAEEKPRPAEERRLPGNLWLFVVAAVAVLGAVGGSLWAYLSGLGTFRALAAQIGDNEGANHAEVLRLVTSAQGWASEMVAIAVIGGSVLFLVAVIGGYIQRRQWYTRHIRLFEESESKTQRAIGQVADSRVSAEEVRKALSDSQQRLVEITAQHSQLQKELTERKQSEKSLTQQAQQLERSKDVLEMHVQARTQELQKLQRRNELILNSAGEGICGFDLEGKVTFANPAAAKSTGWKVDQMIGKTEFQIFFSAGPKGFKETAGFAKDDKGR